MPQSGAARCSCEGIDCPKTSSTPWRLSAAAIACATVALRRAGASLMRGRAARRLAAAPPTLPASSRGEGCPSNAQHSLAALAWVCTHLLRATHGVSTESPLPLWERDRVRGLAPAGADESAAVECSENAHAEGRTLMVSIAATCVCE